VKSFLVAAVVALAAGGASAAPMAEFPDVDETSYVEADGGRAIQVTVEVAAPPQTVWERLSTAEGWKRFAVKSAWVDFRTGGVIETSYKPDAVQGAPENIRNRIEAYVPGRLLVIRNVQAPPDFANAEAFAQTLTILEVRPVRAGASAVTLTAVGFRPGSKAFDDLYSMFRQGDAWTLNELRKSFSRGDETR
jgi:uncharacterized protein YndB with AHSA1/START domain